MNIIKDLTSFITKSKRPLIVVLGPTASGKTKLAVSLAKKFNTEIISCDSRQVYKNMDIATAMVTKDEMQGVKHHLINFLNPDQEFNVQKFKNLATKEINKMHKANKPPILAGGTGLYLSSIIENYDIPKGKPDIKLRTHLEKLAEKEGKLAVYNILTKSSPDIAKKIHPNNLRYVIRAIERAKQNIIPSKGEKTNYELYLIAIKWPRDELYKRIDQRVEQMFEAGILNEVASLIKNGYSKTLPSMTSVGIKEIIPYLEGEIELEECKNLLKKNTRNYAKRQLTWFRRYKEIKWISPEEAKKLN